MQFIRRRISIDGRAAAPTFLATNAALTALLRGALHAGAGLAATAADAPGNGSAR